MKYIRELKEGDKVYDIYLCKHKQSAMTKNGKPYDSVILQDKTGTLDAKVWDPNNAGIEEYSSLDYIEVHGDVINFQGALQLNVKRIRRCKESEYNPSDYLPVSKKDNDKMYRELIGMIDSVKEPYLRKLLNAFFREDEMFIKKFRRSSAAKTIHHGFMGGLLEHSLSVAKLCDYYCTAYPMLKRDLLITAAICHDIGKVREISLFPENDYTDEGQFLGHIVIGSEMISEKVRKIPGFPKFLETELKHCILSHHGEYEFGSPKKPALMEAVALAFADNTDAKLETFAELLENNEDNNGWWGFNKLFESNLHTTKMD